MLRKLLVIIFLLAIFLGGGFWLLRKIKTPIATTSDRPVIATTLVPLTILTKNLASDFADVQSVLPPGAEPHEVTLSPRELMILQRARVVVRLGLGLDLWVLNGVAATSNQPSIITVGALLGIEKNIINPHIWVSPKRMLMISDQVATALQLALPEHAGTIAARGRDYHTRLAALDQEYKALEDLPHKEIVTLHNAFGYLAEDYGLRVVGVIQSVPEGEPTPADVAKIIDDLKKFPAAPLFGERGIQPAILRAIAHDTGRQVKILDPLEMGETNFDQYEVVMRRNLQVLEEALR